MSGMKRSKGIYYYEDDDVLNWIKFDKVIKYSSYYKYPSAIEQQQFKFWLTQKHTKKLQFLSLSYSSQGGIGETKKAMTINWHELFWRKFIYIFYYLHRLWVDFDWGLWKGTNYSFWGHWSFLICEKKSFWIVVNALKLRKGLSLFKGLWSVP